MLKAHVGEDWFRGQLVNGAAGIFPKSFVEVVVSLIVHTCTLCTCMLYILYKNMALMHIIHVGRAAT